MEWLHFFGEFFEQAEATILQLGVSPWLLLVVLFVSCLDGFFPPVPSESIVTAAAVVGMTGGGSMGFLALLVVAAALGAFLGDHIAYAFGARVPLTRLPGLRGPRAQAAFSATKRMFARRGSTLILTGRFVPIGRIAVNITAGSTAYPLARFIPLVALASVLWSCVAVATGALAGHMLKDHPLLAVLVGIGTGILSGMAIDWLAQSSHRKTS
ncbi:MAG TPA: VTT domain-containing protein [Enteractinococcus helveticum]|uniref:VTT domain-containing protein n=1 Tax=Enteractinococcus helveticum TaxID=1837282 RepID=A0A921FPD9_9MICC|nr:VTT domain-containing protein [Enteractinococcus helveticum]HJF15271.1 VTT domain-containing protein [Enteractinococcus helveticum]